MATTIGRVLRDRNAGLYLTAVVVSGFGSSAMALVSGIWVKELTGSDGLAALCTLALWAPLLLGPLLGTLADRTRRRPLLVAVNVGLGVLLLPLLWVDRVGGAAGLGLRVHGNQLGPHFAVELVCLWVTLAADLSARHEVEVVLRCVDRVEALASLRGGTLDAAPLREKGFRVRAELPLGRPDA